MVAYYIYSIMGPKPCSTYLGPYIIQRSRHDNRTQGLPGPPALRLGFGYRVQGSGRLMMFCGALGSTLSTAKALEFGLWDSASGSKAKEVISTVTPRTTRPLTLGVPYLLSPLPRPSFYPLLESKYPLLGTIYGYCVSAVRL